MNATEARKKAEDVLTNGENSALNSAMLAIKAASSKGNFECWFYENMPPTVRDKLTEMGYSVGETRFDRNDTLTKIEW